MSNTTQTLPQINRNLLTLGTADTSANKHGVHVNPLNFSKLGANIMSNNQSFGNILGSESFDASSRPHERFASLLPGGCSAIRDCI